MRKRPLQGRCYRRYDWHRRRNAYWPVFSYVVRGFGIGLAGSAAYIVARKGKEVEIPVQSNMLVRIDNTVTVPGVTATDGPTTPRAKKKRHSLPGNKWRSLLRELRVLCVQASS